MSRPYICQRCGKTRATDSRRGPLPRNCETCKIRLAELAEPEATVSTLPPAQVPAPRPSPFAMHPTGYAEWPGPSSADMLVLPPALAEPAGPGLLETQLEADLAAMVSTNPMAGVLKASARVIARAADSVPPDDLKGKLAAVKELRTVLGELTKVAGGGKTDDDDDDGIFGAVRPEVVHPT